MKDEKLTNSCALVIARLVMIPVMAAVTTEAVSLLAGRPWNWATFGGVGLGLWALIILVGLLRRGT